MTTCWKCGRALRDPKSIKRGYGPECWASVTGGFERRQDNEGKLQSDFSYHINANHEQPVLVITDLDRGGMSVTNNIEAIVANIAAEIGVGIYLIPIVYRDSDGKYDGVNGERLRTSTFYYIGEDTEEAAIRAALERRKV